MSRRSDADDDHSYDTAGRTTGVQTVVSAAGADGADVPARAFSCDPAAGLLGATVMVRWVKVRP